MARLKIAIVHDALVNTGGAERVLMYMHETFPKAPIFTSVYLPGQTYAEFHSARVISLPGSQLGRNEKRLKQLFPLWVFGFRSLNLNGFDIVVSSSTWGAKFISPAKGIKHVCYCYAPFRLLWNPESYRGSSLPVNGLGRKALDLLRAHLRELDRKVTQAIPRLGTTCGNMAKQIFDCYRREAKIIYAPIRLSDYSIGSGKGEYYLVVSRLISHKRIDLAILACQKLCKKLVIVGDGPERSSLMALTRDNVRFMGRVSEVTLKDLYSNCKAVIFPSDEDYGLVPLEAQASGRPVIAFGSGGSLETVIEKQTGIFFPQQTVESVIDAILAFEKMQFDPVQIRHAVRRFDIDHFKGELRDFVLNE